MSRRQTLTALRWSAVLALLLFGACLIGPTTAQAQTDSAYTADTTAIVQGLWKIKGPGKRWLLVPAAVVGGMLDRDAGGYALAQDRWGGQDKQLHAVVGGVIGWHGGPLVGCATGVAWEVGQMRPAGFPRARQGDVLGHFSRRDAVVTCAGAVAAWGARRAYSRWAR